MTIGGMGGMFGMGGMGGIPGIPGILKSDPDDDVEVELLVVD
jgi:hypothetical protein